MYLFGVKSEFCLILSCTLAKLPSCQFLEYSWIIILEILPLDLLYSPGSV